MKKTMLAVMATVGLAFGAKADLPTTTGFEDGTFDVVSQYEWSAATTNGGEVASLELGVVTNYVGDAAPTGVKLPAEFESAGSKYLSVDTSGDILYRNVNNRSGGTKDLGEAADIGGGLYFDASVQFTASDSAPEPNKGDKLIVWLSADDEAGTTNLIVTASSGYDEITSVSQSSFNYTNNNQNIEVNDNEWHRLTVAAATNDTMTTFKVYVDGKLVTADGVTDGKFKSLVGSGDDDGYNTLTAVGFQGTGALDNLVWTTDDPFPEAVPTTVNFSLTVTDEYTGADSITYKVGEDDPIPVIGNVVESTAIAVEEQSITIAVTVLDDEEGTYDVAATLNGEAYSVIPGTKENDLRTDTITIDIRGYETGSAVAVVVTIAEAEHTHTINPATESLGENGTLPVEAGTTTIKIGDYNVTKAFEFNEAHTAATLKPLVVADTAPEEDDAFVIDDENVTINVNPVEGLYYGVDKKTNLGALARPETLMQYTGKNKAAIFTVTKPEGTAAFFKVYVDIKATK